MLCIHSLCIERERERELKKENRNKIVSVSCFREISWYNLPACSTSQVGYFRGDEAILEAVSVIDSRRHECDRGNATARDRGWKTYALLLGDGNEIHETSRVTVLYCMPMHRSPPMPAAIIENTEMRSVRMHANASAIGGGAISF